MKVSLVFPPHWAPTGPYLSCPSLTAFLRRHGAQVEQHDANLQFFEYLLSKPVLENAKEQIRNRFHELRRREHLSNSEKKTITTYAQALMGADELIEGIDGAVGVLRHTKSFFDIEAYTRSRARIDAALCLTSAPFDPVSIGLVRYRNTIETPTKECLDSALIDRRKNIFIDFFETVTMPCIEASGTEILGISITCSDQVLPALTLASMVRKSLPGIHLVAGGGYPTGAFVDQRWTARMLGVFDTMVVFEGETALLRLAEALDGGTDLSDVPNLIRLVNGETRIKQPYHCEEINALPVPDFEGMPLKRYLSGGLVLPYLTSRGCYWGKCAFCTSYKKFHGRTRWRDPDLVARDLVQLSQQYDSKAFFLVDQAISPAGTRRFCESLVRANAECSWQAEARPERGFDRALLALMRRAGCRKLLFGLESGHPRILDLINKGIDLGHVETLLGDCVAAEIAVHLYLMVGFPGETEDEADATADFVTSIDGLVGSPGFSCHVSPFGLEMGSVVFECAERFGIESAKARQGIDEAVNRSFATSGGMSAEQIETKVDHLYSMILGRRRWGAYPAEGNHNLLHVIHHCNGPIPSSAERKSASIAAKAMKSVPVLVSEAVLSRVLEEPGGAAGWYVSALREELLDRVDGLTSIEEICVDFERRYPTRKAFITAAMCLSEYLRQGLIRVSAEE